MTRGSAGHSLLRTTGGKRAFRASGGGFSGAIGERGSRTSEKGALRRACRARHSPEGRGRAGRSPRGMPTPGSHGPWRSENGFRIGGGGPSGFRRSLRGRRSAFVAWRPPETRGGRARERPDGRRGLGEDSPTQPGKRKTGNARMGGSRWLAQQKEISGPVAVRRREGCREDLPAQILRRSQSSLLRMTRGALGEVPRDGPAARCRRRRPLRLAVRQPTRFRCPSPEIREQPGEP